MDSGSQHPRVATWASACHHGRKFQEGKKTQLGRPRRATLPSPHLPHRVVVRIKRGERAPPGLRRKRRMERKSEGSRGAVTAVKTKEQSHSLAAVAETLGRKTRGAQSDVLLGGHAAVLQGCQRSTGLAGQGAPNAATGGEPSAKGHHGGGLTKPPLCGREVGVPPGPPGTCWRVSSDATRKQLCSSASPGSQPASCDFPAGLQGWLPATLA